jgi:uncharacterized protein DUF6484
MGSRKAATMVRIAEAAAGSRAGCRLGWIAGVDGRGLLVDFEGNARGRPLPAPCTVRLRRSEIDEAVASRRGAVLLFEGDDPSRPIVVGLAQPMPAAVVEVLPPAAPEAPREALVDGRRVLIEAADEVVLRCGEASITLQRDGKVVVRGTRITSTARGTHRIRGGSVQIN